MRRSKSNPAKYAKGYRKISQRKMTSHGDNEEEEIIRLRELLRTSSEHLSPYCNDINKNEDDKNNVEEENKDDEIMHVLDDQKKINKKRTRKDNDDDESVGDQAANIGKGRNEKKKKNENEIETEEDDDSDSDSPQYVTDGTELMLPSRKRKDGSKTKTIILSPEEIKAARKRHKSLQRKLQQIESRHEKKKRRTELYKTLSDNAVSEMETALLGKSSELGKKLTKKQALSKILQKA